MVCAVDFTLKASPFPFHPPVSESEMNMAQLTVFNMRGRGRIGPKAMMSSPFV